jgi:hypothetical protein
LVALLSLRTFYGGESHAIHAIVSGEHGGTRA